MYIYDCLKGVYNFACMVICIILKLLFDILRRRLFNIFVDMNELQNDFEIAWEEILYCFPKKPKI
jgi:hypothetical protein